MGRQRNNPQMKGKEEASETMLNEKSQINYQILSSKQWLSGSSMRPQRITSNYRETTMNSPQTVPTRKGNRNYQQGPRGNEEYNF